MARKYSGFFVQSSIICVSPQMRKAIQLLLKNKIKIWPITDCMVYVIKGVNNKNVVAYLLVFYIFSKLCSKIKS